ncbi:hypothetical protein K458DRAFT_239790, partial [Lentithecium fluviatile CBS 122367]
SDLLTLSFSGFPLTTAKSTLRNSKYFHCLITWWESGMGILPNGTLFIDADVTVFPMLLEYLRRPTVYPLLWDHEKGYDHAMYSRLAAEADFFMVEELRDWIWERRYMEAARVEHKTEIRGAWE